jgi:hypothetical protein
MIPEESPFSSIPFSRPWLAAWLDQMNLICMPPAIVGQTELVAACTA